MTTAVPVCPHCAGPTVTLGLSQPWCETCDFPSVVGWKWVDRPLYRLALRLTEKPSAGRAARVLTLAAASVLLLGVLAILLAGLWLLLFEPGFVSKVLGLIVIGVAVVLRPRLGRLSRLLDDAQPVEPARAPELFRLVERIIFRPTYEPARGIIAMIAAALTRLFCRIVSGIALLLQAALYAISQRDSQRAEYLADELGARAGGTDAAVRLADQLLLGAPIETVIQREARAGNGMDAWRAAAATARANQGPNIPVLRRLSRYTQASVLTSHPPAGRRAEMLSEAPAHPAAVVLDPDIAERVDAELTPFSGRVRRALAEAHL